MLADIPITEYKHQVGQEYSQGRRIRKYIAKTKRYYSIEEVTSEKQNSVDKSFSFIFVIIDSNEM